MNSRASAVVVAVLAILGGRTVYGQSADTTRVSDTTHRVVDTTKKVVDTAKKTIDTVGVVVGSPAKTAATTKTAQTERVSGGDVTIPAVEGAVRLAANLSEKTLTVMAGDNAVKTFRVAVGTSAKPTPKGSFKIRKIVWNPAWIPPDEPWAKGKTAKGPGEPGNPMKVAKIFFQEPDYYIHGTSAGEQPRHRRLTWLFADESRRSRGAREVPDGARRECAGGGMVLPRRASAVEDAHRDARQADFVDDQRLVLRHRRIDLVAPAGDPAGEVEHLLETRFAEVARRPQAAHARVTMNDDLRGRVEL